MRDAAGKRLRLETYSLKPEVLPPVWQDFFDLVAIERDNFRAIVLT